MRLHERVLCPYPLAKYAAAFLRNTHARTRGDERQTEFGSAAL